MSMQTQAPPVVLSHSAFQVPDESIELCVSSTSIIPSLTFHTEPKLVPWTITLRKCAAFGIDQQADEDPLILCLDPGVPIIDTALQTLVRSYKTLHVFSPKLGCDIIAQPLSSACESPIQVILDGADILEDGFYHLQVWLTGSSRRSHKLACTSPSACSTSKASCEHKHRLEYCEKILMALRHDAITADVSILISESKHTTSCGLDVDEDGEHVQGRDGVMVEETAGVGRQGTLATSNTDFSFFQNDTVKASTRQRNEAQQQEASPNEGSIIKKRSKLLPRRREARRVERSLKAHKVVLDANPYFYHMLNSGFKESRPTIDETAAAPSDSRLTFNVVLSSDLFPSTIMDCLLDYLYCLKPFPEYKSPDLTSPTSIGPTVEHVTLRSSVKLSAISDDPHCQPLFLGLNEWGALYRVSQVLEIQELELIALQNIRDCLNVDTVFDEFMDWGYQHEAVKAIMMDFLVRKRHTIFGSEVNNQLRPYLYADNDDQVDTLVQLTSHIARK